MEWLQVHCVILLLLLVVRFVMGSCKSAAAEFLQEHAEQIEQTSAAYTVAAVSTDCQQHGAIIAGVLTGARSAFADIGNTQITACWAVVRRAQGCQAYIEVLDQSHAMPPDLVPQPLLTLVWPCPGVLIMGEVAMRHYVQTATDGSMRLSDLAAKFLEDDLPVYAVPHPSALLCSFQPPRGMSYADYRVRSH